MSDPKNDINTNKTGDISVDTEHLFPIIKKWLYSEKEIFLREIVSNASDAITKIKRLISLGKIKDIDDEFKIIVKIDKECGTLTVSDNGIGMNEEEIQKYICQIALSGALEFIEKYEGDDASSNGIIGHFGLGFYSAFMVSDRVDVISKSWDGSHAVKWTSDEDGKYELNTDAERDERGTDIVMHITEDEKEFLEESKIRELLNKYCAFVPVEIYLEKEDDNEKEEKKDEEESEENKPVNDPHPLWLKNPSDCTDEEYNDFYSKLFTDFREPLFHLHINADYPLNFKGILYFPKLNPNIDPLEGKIKLYYNQVFVSDNIKELLPDYLLMLRGVIDCPELPLNVSRSYMQNSAYVTKMAAHISKKVADKINAMFNTERSEFEKLWPDIKTFIEYACLRDNKFYDRVKSSVILQLTDDTNVTLTEYLESAKEKHENTIYYTDDKATKSQYINMFTNQGIKVVVFDSFIDTQFINVIESSENVKMMRVDAELSDALKENDDKYENKDLEEIFKKFAGEKTTVKFESLKDATVPAILSISEQSRRFGDMMKIYSIDKGEQPPDIPMEQTLILNRSNEIIKKLEKDPNEDIIKQVYSLALLSNRPLNAKELSEFLENSYKMIDKAIN